MKLHKFIAPALLLALSCPVFASTAEAEKHLQDAVNETLATAKSSKDNKSMATKLRPVLEKHINFETMTRRAVGPGWRQFTPAQQAKAIDLFTVLIIRGYSGKLTPNELPEIKFKAAVEPAPGRVEIPTLLAYKGSNYNVTYRLEQADNWRVSDIIIEGVSLIANYRSQFDAVFKKGGAEAVVKTLTETAAQPQ
ncbi:MAG: MlaC/ttg2D family ABC transporter substrate-binding protein [Chthoniobacterales bacterium]